MFSYMAAAALGEQAVPASRQLVRSLRISTHIYHIYIMVYVAI